MASSVDGVGEWLLQSMANGFLSRWRVASSGGERLPQSMANGFLSRWQVSSSVDGEWLLQSMAMVAQGSHSRLATTFSREIMH